MPVAAIMPVATVSGADPVWLSAFPILAAINDRAWRSARQSARLLRFPSNTILMRPGQPCQGFMLLAQGSVRVYERAENGREIVLYRTRAGEMCVLPLATLVSGVQYDAEAVAEEEVQIVSISVPEFRYAFANSEDFSRAILAALAQRVGDLMCLVGRVAFQGLDLRLACLLGQHFGQRRTTILNVTHQELARELGTTREVISRLLKEFKRMGCIHLRRGVIELISLQDLARLSRTAVA